MSRNEVFLRKSEALRPKLLHTEIRLGGTEAIKKGEEIVIDFGNHHVGYINLCFEQSGKRHQDAPVLLEVSFLESKKELSDKPERYKGWICASWIQTERIHLDVLPCAFGFSRRYAFRYMRVKVLEAPKGLGVTITEAAADCVTSADDKVLLPFDGSEQNCKMDAVAVRTLHECMQEVFEDGPKRDRRLWLGDLRLQALANYETYRNFDLVKRCLYLFAGDTLADGRVSNNMFLTPTPEADGQWMFDYSLFFINTLWDYYKASGDLETFRELEPAAKKQAELSKDAFDQRHLIDLRRLGNCFVDWQKWLDKQASAQAIYIYALKALLNIEAVLGNDTAEIEKEIYLKSEAARKYLYHAKKRLFVSGPLKQVSYASQVWMILAGIVSGEEARDILSRVEHMRHTVGMATPYMYHHYIQVLIDCGETQRAYEKMNEYWGAMLTEDADTFYEVFDPKKPNASPYGGRIIHSYCHAWSCTPTYFLRKYFAEVASDGT